MRLLAQLTMNTLLIRLVTIMVTIAGSRLSYADNRSPVYLWGIVAAGCKTDASLTRAVESKLKRMTETVIAVKQNHISTSSACSDVKCADLFLAECPHSAGTLFGGSIVVHKMQKEGIVFSEPSQGAESWYRLRLWKVNLSTRQTEIREHVCHDCNLSDFAARHAAELIEQTPAEPENQNRQVPLAEASSEPEAGRSPERVVLFINSVSREQRSVKIEIVDVLKRHIRLTGRNVSVEEKKSQVPLRELRSRNVGKHLLELSLTADSGVEIRFLEQSARESVTEDLKCFGCTEDELAHRVTMAVSSLLDRCTGDRCRAFAQDIPMHQPISSGAPSGLPMDCEPAPVVLPSAPSGPSVPQSKSLLSPCASVNVTSESPPPGDGVVQLGSNVDLTPRRNPAMWSAGWTLFSVGVAGLAVMGTMLVLDRYSGSMTCQETTGSYDNTSCQTPLARPTALGAGLTGGGLAVTGAVLLGRSRRVSRPLTR
jgi:hypothetical protein